MRRRRAVALGVLALHALAGWLLLRPTDQARGWLADAPPLTVQLLAAAAPALTPPAPPRLPLPTWRAPAAPALDVPVVVTAPTTAVAPPMPPASPAPPAPSATATPAAAEPVIVPTAAPAPPPRRIPPDALRYRVAPAVEVPLASRRLREAGRVVLAVRFDPQGVPSSVQIKRSSGFERLDAQALAAMRAARITPCTDDGAPVACEADAPIDYELEP